MPDPPTAQAGRLRRLGRRLLGLALIALLALAFTELGLHVASLFAPDRRSGWREDAERRVLAVGDSHTWGTGVERHESYPAQLQQRLDELEPGDWSVVNLGVPGMSTTQVRHRLEGWIERYRPDAVIVWCGVNNAWNHAERDAENWADRLRAWASHSRVLRLVSVWRRDREIEGYADEGLESGPGSEWEVVAVDRKFQSDEAWTLRHGGRTERVVHARGERTHSDQELQALTQRDLETLVEIARAAGVEIVFVTYPKEKGVFAITNRAIRAAARHRGVPVIDSGPTLERVPAEARDFQWAGHPTPPVYREIARDLASALATKDGAAGAG